MRVLTGLVVLSALGVVPVAAQAASVTYTSPFYPGAANADPTDPQNFEPPAWTGDLQGVSLPSFDPALGTLTGVTLSLYGNILTSGSLTNNTASDITTSGYVATLDISLLSPGIATPWDPATGGDLTTVHPVVFSFNGQDPVAPGESLSFGNQTPVNVSDTQSYSTTDVSPYIGTGSIDFPLAAAARVTTDDSGKGLDLVQNTVARAQATVIYTYDLAVTDVPEPASAALLGAGLLGLCLLRQRA